MTTKLKIPKIRFKEFSGEWEEKKFGKLFDNIGGTALEKYVNENGEYNFISIGNYTVDGKYIDNKQRINLNEKTKTKLLNKNNLVMVLNDKTLTGDMIGSSILIDQDNKYIYNQRSERLICKNEINPLFAWFFLNSKDFRKKVVSVSQGGTQIYVNFGEIKKLEINFPTLKEQEKIADFLSGIYKKIEKIKEKKKNLEDYKKGVMQKIFSQEMRFKDESGEEFGEWEEKSLGEICEKQSSNISANTLENNTGNYKIYGATGFLKFIDFYQEENDYISIVKDGAGVGRVLYCEGKSSVLGTLDKIKPKDGTNLYFLLSILRNIDFKKYTIGSTIPHIYFKDYGKEKFPFPTLKEQEKIADFLSEIDEKIEKVSDELGKMEEFKKGLLQGMFV